jgi:hypothetical protein
LKDNTWEDQYFNVSKIKDDNNNYKDDPNALDNFNYIISRSFNFFYVPMGEINNPQFVLTEGIVQYSIYNRTTVTRKRGLFDPTKPLGEPIDLCIDISDPSSERRRLIQVNNYIQFQEVSHEPSYRKKVESFFS